MEKMKPYTPEWERQANIVARDFAPMIHPCEDCGSPFITGYGCSRCESPNRPMPNDKSEATVAKPTCQETLNQSISRIEALHIARKTLNQAEQERLTIDKATVNDDALEDVIHHYYCVLDGTQLHEIRLGFLVCPKCHTQYLPTQTNNMYSLSWA